MNSSTESPQRDGRVVIIGGVSGSGKSTAGKVLAERLGWLFIEGDAFHTEANVEKMRRGEPLDDDDRRPWLNSLRNEITHYLDKGVSVVLACSSLKARYRDMLRSAAENVSFVFLIGDRENLHRRLVSRQDHFMGVELLASQLAALELTDDILLINSEQAVETIVDSITDWLTLLENEHDET
ncbi:MAG: gluconokinase [Methylicorpusculum sp.]|uniref:gluconokinase n=1 Tax=Methylicorpusculum sp. TaxID=2713644 RepID=UPI002722BC61|nr:gluconokinase [Methylicorpusculum sp.]MDO8844439.1 gluconokinase [Methylicorpusculum sp.]MDO8938313.1 gluconokinase [Methylicorpusculum sp.]MDP2200608.1 gluconokinase [Methylicorpusculum sp.]